MKELQDTELSRAATRAVIDYLYGLAPPPEPHTQLTNQIARAVLEVVEQAIEQLADDLEIRDSLMTTRVGSRAIEVDAVLDLFPERQEHP